ncbi:MAG TPA: hypothetical protein VED01_23435 [Burkholderiales bacterium]|nr:hypothetical protein [Burkholderiales bacterium]
MNRFGAVVAAAALAAISTGHVCAQRTVEPAVPRALEQQRPAPTRQLDPPPSTPAPAAAPGGTWGDRPMAPQAAPAPMQLQMNARRAQRDRDARHCLSLATNRQVHRCSLAYRSRGARAAVVKASTKKSTKVSRAEKAAAEKSPAPAVSTVKPEAPKGGAPRPEDKAKAADLVKPMDVTRPSATGKAAESAPKAATGDKSIPSAEAAAKKLNLPRMGPGPDPTAAK